MLRNRPLLATFASALVVVGFVVRLFAAEPAWWTDSSTRIKAAGVQPDNYAPTNLGQLKHVATQAKKHLDQKLATVGGAGTAINQLVAGFQTNTADNYAPVNLGQLKAVAKPFYDRLIYFGVDTNAGLIAHGYPSIARGDAADWPHAYPWNPNDPWNHAGAADKTINYAPVNLGQLKLTFSFNADQDTDGDGLPDWWEHLHANLGLDPHNPNDAGTTAPGGVTYLEKYQYGLNPSVADTDGDSYDDGVEIVNGTEATNPDSRPEPLDLRIDRKGSVISRTKPGFEEFINPSDPPKYYLTRTQSVTETYSVANDFDETYNNFNTETQAPAQHFSLASGTSGWVIHEYNEYQPSHPLTFIRTGTEGYCSTIQHRTRENYVDSTVRSYTLNDLSSEGATTWTYDEADGYSLSSTFQPGPNGSLWDGDDFVLATGTIGWSGLSTLFQHEHYYVTGYDSVTDASATADANGEWAGTWTYSLNGASSSDPITDPPWTETWVGSPHGGPTSTTRTNQTWAADQIDNYGVTYTSDGTEELTDEYTTAAFKADTISDMPDYPANWTETGPDHSGLEFSNIAFWDLAPDETLLVAGKGKYKLKANPSAPQTIVWFEYFIPYDNPDTSEDESLNITVHATHYWQKTATTACESPEYEIIPTGAEQNGIYSLSVPLIELLSDLNNDGTVSGSDSTLKMTGAEDSASDDAKEKATEYLFVNDQLSNGVWDAEDSDPNKPAGTKDDDDLTELRTFCAATKGAVWFEYEGGDISKLAFYKSKECTVANKVTFPFALSETNTLPERLYVRAEGNWTAQVEGKIVMKYGKGDMSETWATDKLRFYVVNQIGDTKYFHAARDYMLEQNSRLHVRYFKSGQHQIRITAMRHESTDMKAMETFHTLPNVPKLYGMPAVVTAAASQDPKGYYDLLLNGNFVFHGDGGLVAKTVGMTKHTMTDHCHGGCVVNGAKSAASTVGGSSDLDKPVAKYLSASGKGTFGITKGLVPLDPPIHQAALGGFPNNFLGWFQYNHHPWIGIAEIGPLSDRNKLIFTVTPTDKTTQYPVADLVQRLSTSGVPAFPGEPGRILCVAGDGGTSCAIAHRIEGDSTRLKLAETKHYGDRYWVNTYIGFKSAKPRQ